MRRSPTRSPSEADILRTLLRHFPENLLKNARESTMQFAQTLESTPSKIAYFGVGGSGIAAALTRPFLPKDSPVRLLNGLRLSAGELKECDFLLFVSYSGDSEEVLRAFARLDPRSPRAVCITSGGALAGLAHSRNVPVFSLRPGYLPRFALPDLMGGIFGLLASFGLADPSYLEKACQHLEVSLPGLEESAQRLYEDNDLGGAERFLIGAFSGYEALARRWAGQICENAKTEAEPITLPEAFHNLIVPLCEGENLRSPRILLLTDAKDGDDEMRRINAFQETLKRFGRPEAVVIGGPQDSHRGARILGICLLGDFFSIALAEKKGVPIRDTPSIQTYKRLLRQEDLP